MKNSQQTNWTKFIKNYLIESIEKYEGVTVYGCDLAYLLTESGKANGSFFCSTYKTEHLHINSSFTK